MLAFTGLESASSRLEFLPLQEHQHDKLVLELQQFDVASAHCYDPNEEAQLAQVIRALGPGRFNERIHSLADAMGQARHQGTDSWKQTSRTATALLRSWETVTRSIAIIRNDAARLASQRDATAEPQLQADIFGVDVTNVSLHADDTGGLRVEATGAGHGSLRAFGQHAIGIKENAATSMQHACATTGEGQPTTNRSATGSKDSIARVGAGADDASEVSLESLTV